MNCLARVFLHAFSEIFVFHKEVVQILIGHIEVLYNFVCDGTGRIGVGLPGAAFFYRTDADRVPQFGYSAANRVVGVFIPDVPMLGRKHARHQCFMCLQAASDR